ncbi:MULTISPECIES: helix-turn-helix transcriptional regulator [unclassified Streptomyces]|uniref:helix-turn-helix domain-containing protein n=1 Tax=unclassified Streptomyces TaxID=2593676 RepID=UPI000CD4CFF0|nr:MULTISPECIES: helix-turn-helix transcriptional regulator [unclassified Streptomyces]
MKVESPVVGSEGGNTSPLKAFGYEVRLERERLRMTRAELGERAHCGYSLVAKIESGDRVAAREFAETCDEVFPYANGRFVRLWELVLMFAYPSWFRPYVRLEQAATAICEYHPLLVPGLAQTEGYARAIFQGRRPENLEDMVTARLERQRILARDEPPQLWIVLEEAVLRRRIAGPSVMADQLRQLRGIATNPRHVVQLIPSAIACYPAAGYPYSVLSFDEGADVVHADGFPTGHVVAESGAVQAARRAYDLLKATAMPPDESVSVIDSLLKELT